MKYRLLTTTLLTGLTAAGIAHAQTGETDDGAFCTADYSPSTSKMSGEERASSEFAVMDTDGDGMVSQAEYIDCKNAASGTESAETDRSEENMAEADTDASGDVTREEFLAAMHQARLAAAAAADPGDDAVTILRRYVFVPLTSPDADIRGMSEQESSERAAAQFASLDGDGNDSLSKQEWSQRSSTLTDRSETFAADFEELDADASGTLSEPEFREAFGSGGTPQEEPSQEAS